MTDTQPAPGADTIDATALGRWMDAEKLPGTGTPALTRLSGGSQNELFVVERDGIRTVLRIPPATAGEARFDVLRRESRLLRALTSGAPVLVWAMWRPGCVDRAVRVRPGAAQGPRLRAGARRRPAVQGRLGKAWPGRLRPPGELPRPPGRPLADLPEQVQVPRPARPRRGQRLAAQPPAAPLGTRRHARRLPVRQRHVRSRGPGQAGRGHRL